MPNFKSKEHEQIFNSLLETQEVRPWKQMLIENLTRLGLSPFEQVELRVIRKEHTDIFKLAQTAADTFFSAFQIYPTSLAVHSTIAHLFEASEHTIIAKHKGGEQLMSTFCGSGLALRPLRIEIDDSLDTKTVAARFSMDIDEYKDEIMEVVMRNLGMMGK